MRIIEIICLLLDFCLGNNFSFQKISLLGKFLKEMFHQNKFLFLKNLSFEREEISMMARSFGDFKIEELKNELSNTPFSVIIDNATVAKKGRGSRHAKFFAKKKVFAKNPEIFFG